MTDRAGAISPRGKPAQWLKRDLLIRLLLPLLLIMVTTAVLGVYTAQRLVDRAFDSWLLDAARSVGAAVRFEQGRALVNLPVAAQTVLLLSLIHISEPTRPY